MNTQSFKLLLTVIKEDFAYNARISGLVLLAYRVGHFALFGDCGPIGRFLGFLCYRILRFAVQQVIAGCEIPAQCRIGRRIKLHHNALGVVINPHATLGDNVVIYHQVTIGAIHDGDHPTLGNRVIVGVGAKVLGSVTVGDGAHVGAQALVLKDIPPHATAVGVPARVIAAESH